MNKPGKCLKLSTSRVRRIVRETFEDYNKDIDVKFSTDADTRYRTLDAFFGEMGLDFTLGLIGSWDPPALVGRTAVWVLGE